MAKILSDAQKKTISRLNDHPMKGTTRCRLVKMQANGVAVMSYKSDGKSKQFKITRTGSIRQ